MWSTGIGPESCISPDHAHRVVTSAANLGSNAGNTGTGLTPLYATVTSSTFHTDVAQGARNGSPQVKSEDASDSVERTSATDDSDITKPRTDQCDSAERSNAFSFDEKDVSVNRKDMKKVKGKKKLGRPASFNEDEIEWDKLTADERRKIRRRLSNRASAHRVRQRRMEMMSNMQLKLQSMQQQYSNMLSRLATSDAQRRALVNELSAVKEKYHQSTADAVRLQQEVLQLRAKLSDRKADATASTAMPVDGYMRHNQLLGNPALNFGLSNSLTMMGSYPMNTMSLQGKQGPSGLGEGILAPANMSSQFSNTGILSAENSISQPLLTAAALDRAATLSFSLSELEPTPSLNINDLHAAASIF